MQKKKYKFKLTPDIDKSLKKLAASYPEMVVTGKDGKPIYKTGHESMFWDDLPPEDKERLKKEPDRPVFKWEGTRKVIDYYKPVKYIRPVKDLVLVNHYINLTEAYRLKGIEGIQAYTETINMHTVAAQAQKLELPTDETENKAAENAGADS